MGIEIERRFLVKGEVPEGEWSLISQAYLTTDPGCAVRVRQRGGKAWLTVKGQRHGLKLESVDGQRRAVRSEVAEDIERLEFEYEIPVDDAEEMARLGKGAVIHKARVCVPASGGRTWEIDVFYGGNEGLVIAEIELEAVDEEFEKPAWLGKEVSFENRLSNASLSQHPFSQWDDEDRQLYEHRFPSERDLSELSPLQLRLCSINALDGLSVRAANFLNNANILSIGQLLKRTEADLLKYRSFGKKAVNEIQERLAEIDRGLKLGGG